MGDDGDGNHWPAGLSGIVQAGLARGQRCRKTTLIGPKSIGSRRHFDSQCLALRSADDSANDWGREQEARWSFRTTANTPMGDDLRHVDWSAYARSEVLTVRLYREEVAPRIDLVLDVSRSMTVTEEKARAYGQLCAFLACACVSAEADSRVVTTAADRGSTARAA